MNRSYDNESRSRQAGPTKAEETLDRALDAMVRGDHRGLDALKATDPDLAESTAEVFSLATRGGFAQIDFGPDVLPAEWRNHPTRTRRRLVTTLGAVAATIVLAIGLASAVPGVLPEGDGHTPTLAALDAPPAQDGATRPAIDAEPTVTLGELNAEPTATADPSATGSTPPLSPDDCRVEPRTRNEVLEMLSVAPAQDPGPPGVREVSVSEIPAEDLNRVYREWQACVRYGATWQAMALESPRFIRMDIYGYWDFIGRYPVQVPYSTSTLNEILDGRELIDASQYSAWEEIGFPPLPVLEIDESRPVLVSEDGTYITVSAIKLTSSDEAYPRDGYVSFELVDGRWLVTNMSSLQLD